MKCSRGYTLIEIVIALAVGAIVTAGSISLYRAQRLDADIEITRRNAEQLLFAGKTYWSVNRSYPTSVSTLVSQGYVGGSTTPTNPLGGAFSILGTNLSGDIGHIIVRASITRGGTPSEMVKPLDANSTYSTDSVEWKKLVAEYGSGSGKNMEVFKNAYGGGSTLEISSNMANYNIFTMLGSPTSPVNVTLTIPAGVIVSSNSTSTPALDTGPLPSESTVTIINNGRIVGAGGGGGKGGCQTSDCYIPAGSGVINYSGENGQPGGTAIYTQANITIDNTNGYIFGGGGGGGGGVYSGFPTLNQGGGGGGGAGEISGTGGQPGYGPNAASAGASGTSTAGGAGGSSSTYPGGSGGGPGESGSNGSGGPTGVGPFPGGSGGAPGKAVNLNGNTITWLGGNDATRVKGAVN